MRKIKKLEDVEFQCVPYHQLNPTDALVYCDPPYNGTTKYSMEFDSSTFWAVMRKWSQTNKVYVSEYIAPDDFECVLEMQTKTDLRDKDSQLIPRVERLFTYKGTAHV